METKIIDGKAIAKNIISEVVREIKLLKVKGIKPKLVTIQVGENSASSVYVNQQKKSCKKVDINYELKTFATDITEIDLIEEIDRLNRQQDVTGVILQMPVPKTIDGRKIQASIAPEKDVEGVNPTNIGWLLYGNPLLAPCTALAVKEIIDSTGIALYGKQAVVVGHSDIVGKPVALLLLNEFATVSVCHIATTQAGMLEQYVRIADILVVAVGKPNVVAGEWVKQGAVVVDVGINRVDDKIVGDVTSEKAIGRASFITPVPGGVGPVTTAILLKNVIKAAKWTEKQQ